MNPLNANTSRVDIPPPQGNTSRVEIPQTMQTPQIQNVVINPCSTKFVNAQNRSALVVQNAAEILKPSAKEQKIITNQNVVKVRNELTRQENSTSSLKNPTDANPSRVVLVANNTVELKDISSTDGIISRLEVAIPKSKL